MAGQLSHKAYHALGAVFICMLLFACGGKHADTKGYEREKRDRELKVVSRAEILAAGLSKGQEIAKTAQSTLTGQLQKAIADSAGLGGALQYCQLNAYDIIDSISLASGSSIRRVSFKARNKADLPDSLEYVYLDSYQYIFDQKAGELHDGIQEAEQGYLLYTKPITIENGLCLQCHGTPGKDMTTAHAALIERLYPADSAINYQMGDFRGMWSIRIPVKNIVQDL